MAITLNSNQGIKTGSCPHGLPPGACPICSGGGGGGTVQKADFSAKPGEMSWAECAAIGAFLKAQKMAQQEQKNIEIQPFLVGIESKLSATIQKLENLASLIQISMPAIIAKPAMFVLNSIIIPILNTLKNITGFLNRLGTQITQKFVDISDKLAALFGEAKSKIEENISRLIKKLKKKGFSLLGLFGEVEETEEEKKIMETKNRFNEEENEQD